MQREYDDIFQDEKTGKWYFWDEVGYNQYGPHDTRKECLAHLEWYCKTILGIEYNPKSE